MLLSTCTYIAFGIVVKVESPSEAWIAQESHYQPDTNEEQNRDDGDQIAPRETRGRKGATRSGRFGRERERLDPRKVCQLCNAHGHVAPKGDQNLKANFNGKCASCGKLGRAAKEQD